MLSADEEKISVLEKRQAQLISENEETRSTITKTLFQNNHMMKTMDSILNSALFNVDRKRKGLPLSVPEPTVRLLLIKTIIVVVTHDVTDVLINLMCCLLACLCVFLSLSLG
jgi:hypothetical protein